MTDKQTLAARLSGGFTGAGLAVLAIAIMAVWGLLLARSAPAAFDTAPLLWFRAADDPSRIIGPHWLVQVWLGLTWLGDFGPRVAVALAMVAGLLLARRWRGALFSLGVLIGGLRLSSMLKDVVGRARPDLVPRLDHVHSLSFPSGHALNSTIFYLLMAVMLASLLHKNMARKIVWALAISLVLATGVSRIALGVHYPSDIVAGWVMGAAWLWLWLALARRYWPAVLKG